MGSLPALTNATLTGVTGPGFSEDYDDPATAGANKWTGSQPAFFSEITERVQQGGESNTVVRRSLIVDSSLGVEWAIGDVLAVTYDGDARSVTVRRVGKTVATGLDGVVRLVLDDG